MFIRSINAAQAVHAVQWDSVNSIHVYCASAICVTSLALVLAMPGTLNSPDLATLVSVKLTAL